MVCPTSAFLVHFPDAGYNVIWGTLRLDMELVIVEMYKSLKVRGEIEARPPGLLFHLDYSPYLE